MFRRNKSTEPEIAATTVDLTLPAEQQPKGKPTPSRKEAEAARKATLNGSADPKAARNADRQARAQEREASRAALMSGDPKRLPARDAGPVKAYVRDYIDSRLSVGELFIPVAVAVLLLGFLKVEWVQLLLVYIWIFMLIGVVIDGLWIWFRLKRNLAEKLPNENASGATFYGIMRALQLRRFRLPPPRVGLGGKPAKPRRR
jgi:hypothetical protein